MENKKEGLDSKKRWGNSAMKGHGVNSPAMMEARKGFEKKKKELTKKSNDKKVKDIFGNLPDASKRFKK